MCPNNDPRLTTIIGIELLDHYFYFAIAYGINLMWTIKCTGRAGNTGRDPLRASVYTFAAKLPASRQCRNNSIPSVSAGRRCPLHLFHDELDQAEAHDELGAAGEPQMNCGSSTRLTPKRAPTSCLMRLDRASRSDAVPPP